MMVTSYQITALHKTNQEILSCVFEQVPWVLQVGSGALPPLQAACKGQRQTSNLCRSSPKMFFFCVCFSLVLLEHQRASY